MTGPRDPNETVASIVARLQSGTGPGASVNLAEVMDALAENAETATLNDKALDLLANEISEQFSLTALVLQYGVDDLERTADEVLCGAMEGFDPAIMEDPDNALAIELRRIMRYLTELRGVIDPLVAQFRARLAVPPRTRFPESQDEQAEA